MTQAAPQRTTLDPKLLAQQKKLKAEEAALKAQAMQKAADHAALGAGDSGPQGLAGPVQPPPGTQQALGVRPLSQVGAPPQVGTPAPVGAAPGGLPQGPPQGAVMDQARAMEILRRRANRGVPGYAPIG
jgi:hypothetical protein